MLVAPTCQRLVKQVKQGRWLKKAMGLRRHQRSERVPVASDAAVGQGKGYRLSLATALSLFVIAAALVLITSVGSVVYFMVGKSLSTVQEAAVAHQMQHTRKHIDILLENYALTLQDKAKFPVLIQGVMQPEFMEASVADFMDGVVLFGEDVALALLDYQGRLIHATASAPLYNYREQPWIKELVAGAITRHLGMVQTQAGYFWHVAVPVRFNGRVEGILVAELPFSAFAQAFLPHVHTSFESASRVEFFHQGHLVGAYGAEGTGTSRDFQISPLQLVLRLFWDRKALQQERESLLQRLVLGLSLLTVFILSAALVLSKRYVVRPLESLRRLTHAIATGRQTEHVPPDFSLQELQLLSRDFGLMADKINSRERCLENEVRERRQAEAALLKSEQRFRTLVEYAPEAIVVLDLEVGRFVDVNQNAINLFGYPRDALLRFCLIDVSPPLQPDGSSSAALIPKLLQRAEAGEAPVFDWFHRNASGQQIPCEIRLVRLPANGRRLIRGSITDITEKRRAQEALYAEKERAQVTLRSIGDAVISTDADGRVDFLNPIAETLTGWPAEEAQGHRLTDVFCILNEQTREPAEDPVARSLEEGKAVGLANDTLLVSRSGKEYAIENSAAPIFSAHGAGLGAVLVFKDVTEARQLSRQISYQAAHDILTGLLNRTEFDRRLRRVLKTAQAHATENALAYIDLDQFKLVNDTCGHVAGDELLRQLGQLLSQHIRKRDTLARLGGDEFGLLMEHCSLTEAQRVAEELIKVIGHFSFPWEEHSFKVGVSIGLVAVNQDSNGIDGIMSAADSACYMAKERGRNRVHVHQEDDQELARRHGEMQWAVRLPRALEEERLMPYFQMIAPIAGHDGNHISHYELLLRMKDEAGNLILPGVFLTAAERYNFSDRLDRWMITRALHWLQAHPTHLKQLRLCSINLSGLSLSNQSFSPFVMRELEESGFPPEKICFEITETVVIANLSNATRFIKSLRERGCRFALDDFGSGLSSFAYLKNLPVDFLKIDGLFVRDILDDPMGLAMVRSINDIGHVMGKQTIAEFVESDAILEKLIEVGVDYVQGYGIGRPRPLDDVLMLQ